MKSHVQVAVIGGGIVGCSILYHLTKLGSKDVILLERDELTSGSSWHAAGGIHTINADPNLASLQGYTVQLYNEIEELSGQACGVHRSGALYLAATPERLDYLKAERAKARYLGMEAEFVSLSEVRDIHPLIETRYFQGALFDPNDGHVDPSGVVHAYAKAARDAGAEVYRFTPVQDLAQEADGSWLVVTPKGSIKAEIVVNAAGLWGREVAALAGVTLPIQPYEHQYIVTDDIRDVAALNRELPLTIDFEGESYHRQEGRGILIGTYEQDCRRWSVDGTPKDFGHELLEADLDRILDRMTVAYERIPCLREAGVKRVVNGPMVFAPDGNPVIGPVRGLTNYYVACGVMAGFAQGGGVGLALAQWILEGEPQMDVFAMDVARFGSYATKAYTLEKSRENYTRRFAISFPNEELPAARPLKTTPAYDRLRARGAVFGAAFGLEHALWFAPEGMEPVETPTFRRSNAFEPVGEECRAVRNDVGLLEIANFAKYEITGPEAEAWLTYMLANHLPDEGRLLLSPMLSPKGRLMGDFTVAKLAPERFYIIGSGPAEAFHLRWFNSHLPETGVRVRGATASLLGFMIAGPKSRELLARLCREDVTNEAFPFLHIREMEVGPAPALVARISYTGDLGYEIYVAPEYQVALYDALTGAGVDLGLRLFGARALNSLRLEKGFGAWTLEYRPDFTPYEAGLSRYVDLKKDDFIGRSASAENSERAPKRMRVTLAVDADDADAAHDEPVWCNGEVAGFVTSGGYAHHAGKSVALAYVPTEFAVSSGDFEVEILGDRRPARLITEALFDPKGERLRS